MLFIPIILPLEFILKIFIFLSGMMTKNEFGRYGEHGQLLTSTC